MIETHNPQNNIIKNIKNHENNRNKNDKKKD